MDLGNGEETLILVLKQEDRKKKKMQPLNGHRALPHGRSSLQSGKGPAVINPDTP